MSLKRTRWVPMGGLRAYIHRVCGPRARKGGRRRASRSHWLPTGCSAEACTVRYTHVTIRPSHTACYMSATSVTICANSCQNMAGAPDPRKSINYCGTSRHGKFMFGM